MVKFQEIFIANIIKKKNSRGKTDPICKIGF